jgi:hypothetical protein
MYKRSFTVKQLSCLLLLAVILVGCDKPKEEVAQANSTPLQCAKDTDCKGERICESRQCVAPTAPAALVAAPVAPAAPTAPAIAYSPELISDDAAGPFTVEHMDLGTALNYQSRAGILNLMESVVEDPESTGYVKIEKAYSFGPNKYVLIISTGESGNSCPASTYVISFDTKGEYVDGKASIDGCSEVVEAFADANKLSIKKEGETTVVYNGKVE